MESNCTLFFKFLRLAMAGISDHVELSHKEWMSLYSIAEKQSLLGVLWPVVKVMPLPHEIVLKWIAAVAMLCRLNEIQNREAARLTQLFYDAGHKSVILKGQANARLYPEGLIRQPGDIDIWVDGGKKKVIQLLYSLGLLVDKKKNSTHTRSKTNGHHVHLPPTEEGVIIEVHFRPSSGTFNPLTNWRLQQWLEREIMSMSYVEEGFNIPSTSFALVMQLAHIQRHLFNTGVGLRQICDYYNLLQSSTYEQRKCVSSVLKKFGLFHTASALMWLLGEVLQIDTNLYLCKPDEKLGKWMLHEVMSCGDYGFLNGCPKVWDRFLAYEKRHLIMIRMGFWEAFWLEIYFWKSIIKSLPERIQRRSFSLTQ